MSDRKTHRACTQADDNTANKGKLLLNHVPMGYNNRPNNLPRVEPMVYEVYNPYLQGGSPSPRAAPQQYL